MTRKNSKESNKAVFNHPEQLVLQEIFFRIWILQVKHVHKLEQIWNSEEANLSKLQLTQGIVIKFKVKQCRAPKIIPTSKERWNIVPKLEQDFLKTCPSS